MTGVRRASVVAALAVGATAALSGCSADCGARADAAPTESEVTVSQGTVGSIDDTTFGLMDVRCTESGPVATLAVVEHKEQGGRQLDVAPGDRIPLADGGAIAVVEVSSTGHGWIGLARDS